MIVKLYTTGVLSFIVTVASMVAHLERMQGFDDSNHLIFWIGQVILIMSALVIAIYISIKIKTEKQTLKLHFILSLISLCLIYAFAWTNFESSWILICFCGIAELYFTRKRVGLIK